MKQSRHNLLAFPKFNKAVSILPHEGKALLELFCQQANSIGWSRDKDDTFGLAYGFCHVT